MTVRHLTATRAAMAAPHRHALRVWTSRMARGLLAGSAAAVVVAVMDSWYGLRGVQGEQGAPSLGQLAVHDLGVVAPLALIIALGFATLAVLVHPRRSPSSRGLRDYLDEAEPRSRLNRALGLPLMVVLGFAWVVVMAQVARPVLAAIPDPRIAGVSLVASAVLIAGLLGALGLALFGIMRAALEHRVRDVQARLQPWITLLGAVVFVAVLVAWGVHYGTTGGEGGPLGFLGVLKRLELDLRPVALAAAIGAAGYFGAHPLRRVPALLAVILALIPLGATFYTAKALDNEPRVAGVIERTAPLGRPSVRAMRRVTDRDRDGASAYFGGGDCDDRNAAISPTAVDIPGNGIDEDCSGSDLVLPAPPPAQEPEQAASADELPDNLNVVVLSIDTLRSDLGYMGYPRPITPAIDALAARSVIFEKAYAMASYTGKSLGPMMCGKYPSETHRGWLHYNKFPENDIMVQERLQADGVKTLSIQSHWYFKPDTGIGRGFDVLDLSASPAGGVDATTDTTSSADRLTDAVIRALEDEQNTNGRFFAWAHYFDPHAEYVRHKGTMEFGNRARDLYDHEVRWTDDQIARLLSFIEAQPWARRTVIIITSDHGEEFGEHGMWRHGFELWEPLVQVPLVIYVPELEPKRVKVRRSLVDLVPTILDLMKVERKEPRNQFDFLSGKSLVPEILGPADAELPERDVFMDMPAGPYNEERRSFIHQDMKLTIAGGVRYQLFDLKTDPEEKKDLSSDKELLNRYKELYAAFRAGLKEVYVKPLPRK